MGNQNPSVIGLSLSYLSALTLKAIVKDCRVSPGSASQGYQALLCPICPDSFWGAICTDGVRPQVLPRETGITFQMHYRIVTQMSGNSLFKKHLPVLVNNKCLLK